MQVPGKVPKDRVLFFPVRSLDQGSLLVYYGALPLPRVSPRLKLFFYARSVFLDREKEKTILAEI